MHGKIFISYRREDAPGDARGICDRLSRIFGAANVFMDVDSLVAGQRFERELDKALAKCDVLIAVIGSHWMELLNDYAQHGRRDYVREEIAAALQRDIVVVPVTIGHQAKIPQLPQAENLPENIRDLLTYQKHSIAHETFGRDTNDLIAALKTVLGNKQGPRPWRAIAATVAIGLLLAGAGLAYWERASLLRTSDTARSFASNSEAARVAAEERARRRAEAEAKAADEAVRKAAADEAVRQKAAQDEAVRKAAEEAQRQADAEAARQKAEEAAKQKAEAEAKAADEAVRKAAADEAARQKAAQDEAARKAAEEAQRQADADAARQKAEEAAKQKAEADARAAADAAGKAAADEEAARRAATANLVTDCDRLAASPSDSDRPSGVPGVLNNSQIDAAAGAACDDAMRRYPEVGRFPYEAGRTALGRRDYAKAEEFFRAGMAKGSAPAISALGVLYLYGLGVTRDYGQARDLFEKAAARNDPQGMTELGRMYAYGLGVTLDYGEAHRRYEQAALLRHPPAMALLGDLYYDGLGVQRDYVAAREWYEKAAALGELYAMFSLGVLYDEGRGVPIDRDRARQWYQKALKAGYEPAREKLKNLR
jgi:TPR repeat protein